MREVAVVQISANPDIFNIYIPLPGNPLKNLNCYVLKTPEKSLVIDTGFNLQESKEALLSGLAYLGIDMERAEIYATHLHADHTGLIGEIMRDDTVIYMSKRDYETMIYLLSDDGWKMSEESMMMEGFPKNELKANRDSNPARIYTTGKVFTPCFVRDGDSIRIGSYTLTVISTPGHTPGNTCLYMEHEKILFTGDHILFDITPNITRWSGLEDALGSYLENLEKIRRLDIRLALPAHRTNGMDVYERIGQLLEHHDERIKNTIGVLKAFPNASAYEIASHMQWSMRGKVWTDFPVQQKWFAVGETCSHLDYLSNRGVAAKKLVDNIYGYILTTT